MRKILVGIGLMLHVPACMALLSVAIALVFNESFAVKAFLWTAAAGTLAGQLLFRLSKDSEEEFNLTEMMWIASLGWFFSSMLAALPFFLIAHDLSLVELELYDLTPFKHWINAHFEGLSGITTTGLTVTVAESKLPYSVQWWRSFLQWVGGIGIIVFVSTFYTSFRAVSDHYSQGPDKEEILPDVEVRWYRIWWIYILFTLFSTGLLWVQEVPLWEAVNHAMTGISTGGFSILDNSVQTYDAGLRASLIFIMILGAFNYNLFHLLFTEGNWKQFVKDQQHIFFVSFVLAGTAYLFIENNVWGEMESTWMDLLFQANTALATCGFASVTLKDWPDTSLLLLSLAMLIGGSTASTAGGIKILRLLLLIKGNFYNTLQWVYSEDKKLKYTWHGKELSNEESLQLYRNVGTFHFFWILFFVLITFVLIHTIPENYRLSEAIFESASAFGTTGLSTGITGPGISAGAKVTLMAGMLVGRLELIPFVIVFATALRFKRKGKKVKEEITEMLD